MQTATGTAVRFECLPSTPLSAQHEECALSVPPRVPIFSTEEEYPCGRPVIFCFKCLLATDPAGAFHCTARRAMQVAGISTRTRLTARSRTRCRRSTSCTFCASARSHAAQRAACVWCRSAWAQAAWCTCGWHGCASCGARLCRAAGTTGAWEGGRTVCVLRGSRCGRMHERQRLVSLAAACACAQLAEQQLVSRCRPDGARQYDHTDQPVRPIVGSWHGRAL